METTKNESVVKDDNVVRLRKWESVSALRLGTAGDFGRLEAGVSHIADLARTIKDNDELSVWDKDRLDTIIEKSEMHEELLKDMFKRLNYIVTIDYEL